MPKVVLTAAEIDRREKDFRADECINLNFSAQITNPIAFNGATGTIASFQADKDYAIVSVTCTVAVENETTPLAGIAMLTYLNQHVHFPIQGALLGGLVQGDVIFSMTFSSVSQNNLSGINPRNSYLEKGKSIFAHLHNPTATGKTTMMMQVSLLPTYKQ